MNVGDVEKFKTLYGVYVPNNTCNLNCKYCETGTSNFLKEIDGIQEIMDSNYHNRILEQSRRIYDSEILKIVGGGEIFLDKNLEEWVKREEQNYGAIFILTNGIKVEHERVEALSAIKNLFMGISMDGFSWKMNEYRFPVESLFKKNIETFHEFGKNKIPLQINMVMHDKNSSDFFEYLDFLKSTNYTITVHMSPVMPKASGGTVQQDGDIWVEQLYQLINVYDKYKEILLPKAYYYHLINYYKHCGKRTIRCVLPYYMIQLFSTGNITACPIVWNQKIGNVKEYDKDLYKEEIYRVLCRKGKAPFFCRKCISSYDIFSLYTVGQITDEELHKLPLYSSERVFNRIKSIKGRIQLNDK